MGVRLVFALSGDQMYPREQLVTVDPGPMGQVLEGEFRPGFFNGVLTVVLKLFQLVRPEVAVFGEKDAQQLALVRRMVADLDLGITVSSVPTVRDEDGVATSSRNRFLIGAERSLAQALPSALFAGLSAAATGPGAVLAAAQRVLDAAGPSLRVDYLALVDPLEFRPVAPGYVGRGVLAVAARAGATRLIDNVLVDSLGTRLAKRPRGRQINSAAGYRRREHEYRARVFDGEEVVEHWRLSTVPDRTADEIAVVLQGLLVRARYSRRLTSPGSRCARTVRDLPR